MSPIAITTTPVTVLATNRRRVTARFENVGSKDIYMTKQKSDGSLSVPSASVYDFVLYAKPTSSPVPFIEVVASIGSFAAVVASGTSSLAIMETVEVR